ncbi:MAG: response regulator transcription factor [Anaerolineales bacterium]
MEKREVILVVDDERTIRATLTGLLERTYRVNAVESGAEALQALDQERYDLVLLDIQLPDMSGLEILRRIKEQHQETVVIMLTGHPSIDNVIEALRQGATNYLRKPASNEAILASVRTGLGQAEEVRQRTLLLTQAKQLFETGLEQLAGVVTSPGDCEQRPAPARLAAPETSQEDGEADRYLHSGPLQIDTYRRTVTLQGEELELTGGEYDLLLCLVRHAPRVLGPRELVKETRGFECTLFEARDLVRWQVYLLRQKLEPDPADPQFILNVRGKGYLWAGG